MADYIESLNKKLEKEAQKTRKAIETYFNESKSIEDRLKAFQVCGTFTEENDIQRALKIYNDSKESGKIKAAAILGLIHYAGQDETLIDSLIEQLNGKEQTEVVKEAILTVLQANTFSSQYLMGSKQPAYTNALRNVLSEGGSSNKSRAMEYLALKRDEYAQRVLTEGLQGVAEGLETSQSEIVKPEVAIQLLSYDLHADHYPILRKIVANPPNQSAKKEALRSLSSDPDSVDLLLKTFNDKTEDKEIRHVCAVGLQAIKPEALQSDVKAVLTDNDEDDEFKAALLTTLNYSSNTEPIDNDKAFQADLKKQSKSKELKKAYKVYQTSRAIK